MDCLGCWEVELIEEQSLNSAGLKLKSQNNCVGDLGSQCNCAIAALQTEL